VTTPRPRGRVAAGALSGLLAAGVALGVAELAAALAGGNASPVIAVGGTLIDAAPVWLKEFAISTFGTNDKPVLLGSVLGVLALLAALAGALAVRRPVVGLVGVGLLGVVGAVTAVGRPASSALAAVPSLVGAVVGGLALLALLSPLRPRASAVEDSRAVADPGTPDTAGERRGPPAVSGSTRLDRFTERLGRTDRKGAGVDRRGFLVTGVGVAVIATASGALGRAALARRFDASASRAAVTLPGAASAARPVPAGADLKVPGVTPFVTRNGDFYRVDTALVVPQVSTEDWTLRVHGMVDRELELTFDELLDRRMVERDITLTCVSNEVGGPYAGNARWLGTPLAALLEEAGVRRGADQILSRSSDGMTLGTPTSLVMDGRDALLAVGMNGEPLPTEHGFPVRMVVPGLYGYVSATKWLVDLELTTYDAVDAYWTKRDWATDAPIRTMSRIDTPRPLQNVTAGRVPVAGVAWAQHRGVRGVEVRVDKGPWHGARLAPVPGEDTWRQWVWEWDAPPGTHTLEVRARDGTGETQTSRRTNPFPSGATGWHSTVVRVA
jgi:DMSO/TMAO reductase YedYZ molybdopterin-dependent catalytic subunit